MPRILEDLVTFYSPFFYCLCLLISFIWCFIHDLCFLGGGGGLFIIFVYYLFFLGGGGIACSSKYVGYLFVYLSVQIIIKPVLMDGNKHTNNDKTSADGR